MNQSTANNPSTGTRSVRKVRLACVRCRNRRIKCDGDTPACRNCLKANAACVDVDGRNGDVLLPRSFTANCVSRIQWLEEIIQAQLPHVDLSAGPQLDASTKAAFETAPRPVGTSVETHLAQMGWRNNHNLVIPDEDEPADTAPPPSYGGTNDLSPQPDCWESPRPDSNIADEVRALAQSLGRVSLHEDSRQTYYLGTSSGILFAHVIGASASELHDAGWPTVTETENTLNSDSLERLRIILCRELPPRDRCQALIDEYFRIVHPDFPVLDPTSVSNICEALYTFASSTQIHKPGRKGWPVDSAVFSYNGEMEIRDGQYEISIPIYTAAFHLLMIFSLAATTRARRRQLEDSPHRLYRTAMSLSPHFLNEPSLTGVQALVLLAAHSLMTPSEINIWTIVHIAMANSIDIGLHREMEVSPHNRLPIHMRRMVFWTVYSLDRSISSIQGRPLGIRDETFDLSRPGLEFMGDRINPRGCFGPSFDPCGLWPYTTHRLALDRWISAIKLLLYRCPSAAEQNLFMWPQDFTNQQGILKSKLHAWYLEIPNVVSQLVIPDETLRERLRLKLEAQYHSAMMLLFQPSQALRKPSLEACVICYESAIRRLAIYSQLYEKEQLFHSWRSMQDIFHAGVTFIYTVCASPSLQQTVSLPVMSKNMRRCSNLLSTGGEWWPSLKKAKTRLEMAADLMIEKFNTLNQTILPPPPIQDMSLPGLNESGGRGLESMSPTLALPSTRFTCWDFPVPGLNASDSLFQPSIWRNNNSFTFPVVSPARSAPEVEEDIVAHGQPKPVSENTNIDSTRLTSLNASEEGSFDDILREFVQTS
ncbi:hypothetical protein RU639_005403 [Aspergillus parasiticus]